MEIWLIRAQIIGCLLWLVFVSPHSNGKKTCVFNGVRLTSQTSFILFGCLSTTVLKIACKTLLLDYVCSYSSLSYFFFSLSFKLWFPLSFKLLRCTFISLLKKYKIASLLFLKNVDALLGAQDCEG